MEKKFEIPKNCKGFTIKSLENDDFEVVYEIEKKVRENDGHVYFSISTYDGGEILSDNENLSCEDDDRFNFGNYFTTWEQAQRALSYIKEAFDKFWEDENKNSSN